MPSLTETTTIPSPAAKVWPLLDAGRLQPIIHAVLPLEEAAEAHRLMESSRHIGKILLSM